jgi:hypothetical protein
VLATRKPFFLDGYQDASIFQQAGRSVVRQTGAEYIGWLRQGEVN